MSSKTKVVAVRVDQDFYELLKRNGGKNISEYIKNLIVKGMMCELDEMYQRAENFAIDSNKNLSQNNQDKVISALNFLQELSVRIAIKQGYKPEDIKAFYQTSQQNNGE
ncbi:hypothetical protein [Moraxella catarrhalis]|uniref:hypothetical protein n=1 Tax=Moraxella catarrhalis TaxID=480 RepID=UPI00128AFCC9|nr:hypothetical protein [Moraxella catarrhalis]MPX16905.1 hypothetical protein [Moraxella catarrhalis]MPY08994.1 hypothetical protein [Moraxella catarrhalis]